LGIKYQQLVFYNLIVSPYRSCQAARDEEGMIIKNFLDGYIKSYSALPGGGGISE
jgi:hypothetical protein